MTIFVTICLLAGAVSLFWAVPTMARLAAVYALHDLRDDLYALFAAYPNTRKALLLRDTEFVLCQAIRVAKSGTPDEAREMAAALSLSRLKRPQPDPKRMKRYEADLCSFSPEERQAVERIISMVMQRAGLALGWRFIWSVPPVTMFLLLILSGVLIMTRVLGRPRPSAIKRAAVAVPRIRMLAQRPDRLATVG